MFPVLKVPAPTFNVPPLFSWIAPTVPVPDKVPPLIVVNELVPMLPLTTSVPALIVVAPV
jgi:hypothetical protein